MAAENGEMREVIKSMLFVFDRKIRGCATIGAMVCGKARAAIGEMIVEVK
jgi:hypothetical protein